MCRTARSALAIILRWVCGGLISIIWIVLSTIHLQFQGLFVSIFSEASSQNCGSLNQGYILVIMVTFPPSGDFSIYTTAPRNIAQKIIYNS